MNESAVTAEVVRRCVGEPQARVALCHGLGAGPALWGPLAQLLPDTVETWAFGFPWGAGGDGTWAMQRHSRVWLDRALGLMPAPPDVVVAHSFGANVLLDRLVTDGPVGCRGLVLFSPFYRPAPDRFDWGTLRHYVVDFDDLIRAGIVARRGGPPPAAELLEAMVAKVRDRIGPYGWLRFFDLFTETPFLDLSRVDVPCLVVGGELDTASYPADSAGLAAALPDARLEILPGCGHFGLVDNPVPAAALVLGFLDRLGLTAVPPEAAVAPPGTAVPPETVRLGGRDPQPAT